MKVIRWASVATSSNQCCACHHSWSNNVGQKTARAWDEDSRRADGSVCAIGADQSVIGQEDLAYHQARIRKTAPPDQPSADPSSLPASRLRDRMNQRTPCASTAEFFNTIGAKRTFASCQCRVSATSFRTHAVQQNRYFAQRLKPVFSVHAPLVSPLCVAMGAPLESLAHLMIADPIADAFRTVANITGDLMLVAPFDRLRSLPQPVDGVTIVPRAEAFGGAVQDLAQHIPGTVPIIDP